VIGGGGAALAAAATAAEFGRQVVLLEKNSRLGGSTAWSVGSISASNTPHQFRAKIQDSPDAHYEDLGKFIGPLEERDNLSLRRILVDNIKETFDWLLLSGLTFFGPTPEPPHRVPRMHNVVPNSKSYPFHLGRLCRRLGVEIRLSTRAVRLLTRGSRVIGAEARTADGKTMTYIAKRGVVLATGDFSANAAMKRELASEVAARSVPVNETNTGDGHSMAVEIGATILNGDLVHGPLIRFVPPASSPILTRLPPYSCIARAAVLAMEHAPSRLIRPLMMSFVTTALGPDSGLFHSGARLVNQRGERFTDERREAARALTGQPESTGFILMDDEISRRFTAWPHFISTAPAVAHAYLGDYKRNRRDIFHSAPDVGSLAAKLRMDERALRNAMQPSTPGEPALSSPPFVALGPVKSYVVLTEGGLRVSESHQVLNSRGEPIDGLLAAGATGQGGVLLYGHGHHLAWTFVSGRRAGKHAALAPAC